MLHLPTTRSRQQEANTAADESIERLGDFQYAFRKCANATTGNWGSSINQLCA
jgi:hypothetical protein